MYKTFQGMDDLQQMVEQARSMPMTANCIVPRREVLEILDEMRSAIPAEMDDAQDVLDHRDAIIGDAQDHADMLIADAEADRDAIVGGAQRQAEDIVNDAAARADATISAAESKADSLVDSARREYDAVTSRAAAEAERLIADGNDSYNRSVEEGLAEQARLISESEVVRKAEAEARRIIESAHADSDRLRTECDRYVDSTLAEFENTLNSALRVVHRDRAALRKGAGAAGPGGGSAAGAAHADNRFDGAHGIDRRDL